jgi:hypothetical protein
MDNQDTLATLDDSSYFKMGPLHRIGIFFLANWENFVINNLKKNQNTIFQTLSTARVAVSVDLLKIIRWIQLYQSP